MANLQEQAEYWLQKINERKKDRDEGWGKDAKEAEAVYALSGKADAQLPFFNILFSNVETIVPAIFNSMPVPDIRERHRQGDKAARYAADVLERTVSVQTDDSALDTEVEDVARDAEVAGRGVLRVRFSAEDAGEGVENERVTYEAVSWLEYLEGKASRWGQVPWCSFEHTLEKEERNKVYSTREEYQKVETEGDEDAKDTYRVYEIWCKSKREVIFLQESPLRILKREPDPYELKGFFPVCKPVQPIALTGRRDPVPPYKLYKKLAGELDEITRRIQAITKGLKVRGLLLTGASDVERLAQAGDNELVTADNLEGLGAIGIEKAVLWWPIETAVAVLRELYLAREQTKQTIYEVTGISDIVRGASKTQETATAQQIKNQWGSLRIKRRQVMVERLVREAFLMTVELIASKFSIETIQAQAGMQITPEAAELLNDPLMHYRIDVESDSTVRGDLSRQKYEMAEFLKGTAEYFSVMQGVVAADPRVAGPVVALYAAFGRQFNLGRQAETALDELIDMAQQAAEQPQQQENPEAQAAQAEAQSKMQELQLKAQEMQARLGLDSKRLELDAQKQQVDAQKAMIDLDLKREDLALRALDRELKGLDIQIKERDLALKAQEQDRKGFETEAGVAFKAAELEIEREQQRAAKIGDGPD